MQMERELINSLKYFIHHTVFYTHHTPHKPLLFCNYSFTLIDLDRPVDLAVEPEAREVANSTSDQEEGKADNEHVPIVQ